MCTQISGRKSKEEENVELELNFCGIQLRNSKISIFLLGTIKLKGQNYSKGVMLINCAVRLPNILVGELNSVDSLY